MPKLNFSKSKIESTYKVLDEGLYKLRLLGFNPKPSKAGDSTNLNPIMEAVSMADGSPCPTKDDGKNIPVFYNLNTKADWAANDFVHCFGLPMEETGEKDEHGDPLMTIPGNWGTGDKWEYKGPLIGRTGIVYLIKDTYNGKEQNKIKYFVCAVDQCEQRFPKVRHSTDLTKTSS